MGFRGYSILDFDSEGYNAILANLSTGGSHLAIFFMLDVLPDATTDHQATTMPVKSLAQGPGGWK